MKILAIETSAKAASAALSEDGRLVTQYWQASGLTHSKTILIMVQELLENQGITMDDIDTVAVANGPGSFTGIRIGVAAAKGLAWGADKPLVGVSTLESMAYHLIDREGAVICPAMDARRGEIYNAKFLVKDGNLVRLCPDRSIPASELAEEAKKDSVPYYFVGDGAKLCYNLFLEENLAAFMPAEPLVLQSAWGVAMAAERAEPQIPDDVVPNYLRLSQAERERLAKTGQI